MIAVARGVSFHAAWIGTVTMLRQCKTTYAFARNQSRQPTGLLLTRAEGMNRVYHERPLHGCQRSQARVRPFKLLHDEAICRVALPRTTVLFQVRSIEA